MRSSGLLALLMWLAVLASPVFAQAPAGERRIDVTVLDSQGLPIVGAQVTAMLTRRQPQPDGRQLERAVHARGACARRLHAAGVGLGLPDAADVTVDITTQSETVEVRLRIAGPTEQLVVTPTRSEQRVADVPASISVVTQRTDRTVACGRRRRRAAAGADLQPVPPYQQPCRESDGAGRVAARHRSERRQPDARAARRHSIQRSVRRLGVLDARADDECRAHRNHRRGLVQPLRQLRDGRCHQHRDQSPDAAHASSSSRSTATARRPRWICLPATCGASSALPSTPRRCRPMATGSWPRKSAARSTTKPTSRYQNVSAQTRLQPDRSREHVLPVRRVRRRAQQRQDWRAQRHELEVRQRRRASEICGGQQRRGPGVLRYLGLLPEHVCGTGGDARRAARAICRSRRRCRPMLSGSMVQWSRPFQLANRSHVISAGTDFRWIDGDSDELTYALATGLTPLDSSRRRRHAAVLRHLCAGLDRGLAEAAVDVERACRQLEQLRRAQSRDDHRDQPADSRASRVAARQVRYHPQPARGRALSRDRPRVGVGKFQ